MWTIGAYRQLASFDRKLNNVIQNTAFQFDHRKVRLFVIRSQLEQSGTEYFAIAGDSIAEALSRKSASGKPLFNAGIGGATVADIEIDVLPLMRKQPPAGLLIAIGINDSKHSSAKLPAERLADFERAYQSMLTAARALTPRVAVATIGPVEKGKELGDATFDMKLIRQFNEAIRRIAAAMSVPVTELSGLADAQGFAHEGSTIDGVHLTSDAYAGWWAAMERGWSAIVKDCRSS